MKRQLVIGLSSVILTGVLFVELAPPSRVVGAEGESLPTATASPDEDPPPEIDPLGPNGACYVCHLTFVKEEFAKVHLAANITCVKCHGLSDKHANDENVGATKPDITFQREQIDASCDKCHRVHDVPAKTVISRFLERKLALESKLVCIDCHGMHKIEEAVNAE